MSVLKIKNTASGQWDGIASIQGEKGETGGVNDAVALALLRIANHVYYDDDKSDAYVKALQDALYPPANVLSITAVYTQVDPVYDSADVDDLKENLVVTANLSGGSTKTIAAADYFLDGEIKAGTRTITVSALGKTTTFDAVVTREPNGLTDGTYSISGTSSTATVANNELTVGAVPNALYHVYIPFQKPIRINKGDVLVMTGTPAQIYSDTSSIQCGLKSEEFEDTGSVATWSGQLFWNTTSSSRTLRAQQDYTITSLYFTHKRSESRTITISISINGEVLF